MNTPQPTGNPVEPLDALRVTVQAKLAFWAALGVLEHALNNGEDLSDNASDRLVDEVTDIASALSARSLDANAATDDDLRRLRERVLGR